MRKTLYIIVWACAMLLAGCSEDSGIDEVLPNAEPINLSAGYETLTRVTEQGFDDGDQMGVYVVDYVDGKSPGLDIANRHADNVLFTYSLGDNRWTGATTLYWNSKENPVDIFGYYPFDADMSQPTAYSFSVSTRQDSPATPGHKGGYEGSDLLWAKAGNVAPTSETIQLLYHHLMAGVTIRLQEGTGFAAGEWNDAEKQAWLYNTVIKAVANLETGKVEADGSDVARITPLEYNGDFRAVVVPQTVEAGKTLIGLNIGGQNYSLTKNDLFTYTSGKMHTFTIKVDKRVDTGDYEFSLTDEAVTAWRDDEQFHDGLITEYVCVHVEKPGTLGETVEKMGIDLARVENLKVSGTVDFNDFEYIRTHQEVLTKLNLTDVTVDDENDEYDDAVGNLGGMGALHYIYWPKNLKKIYGVGGCPLVGSFILPEGLEYIADGALGGIAERPNAVGELYLPSTLKYLGNGAFANCQFTGELHLPDGLEFLGNNAFSHSIFTGPLHLPSTLKDLGPAAFSNSHFTGDLVIPQGIKELVWTFPGARFDGNLILPEGVEQIHRAFCECGLTGELILPSTVKEISWCFNNNKFTKVILPEGLLVLGGKTFEGCDRLTGTITIPKGVSVIGGSAFEGCRMLTGIELHEDITLLEGAAFRGCNFLTSIVCMAEEPPYFDETTFDGVPVANVTVEVPEQYVTVYQNDPRWKRFKRITAYKNFVTRPQKTCALNTAHEQAITLNSDGAWTVTHKPDWCRLSQTKGNKKSQILVSIDELNRGSGDREDYIEFTLDGTNYTTRCEVKQYDYEHAEDEVVTLQEHTRGNGIKIVFLGDGWNGEDIASGNYLEQCRKDMEYFFGLPPYDRLRDYFDVQAVVALSQESGVNTLYTVLDTRFGTIYSAGFKGPGGYESKLIPDEDIIFPYLLEEVGAFRDGGEMARGLTILVPNTTDYNGITYYFGDTPLSICPPLDGAYPNDMRGVVQHEACGHGFGKLGDEQITMTAFASGNAKSEVNSAHGRGWYQNLATTGKMNDVPWAHLIFNPQYSDYVDIFEGGYGYTRGIYRSEANSCMNYGIPYFNAISRQDITRRVLQTAGEWFDLDEFYRADTRTWGSTQLTRTGNNDSYANTSATIANHRTPIIIKGNELRNELREARKIQKNNNR